MGEKTFRNGNQRGVNFGANDSEIIGDAFDSADAEKKNAEQDIVSNAEVLIGRDGKHPFVFAPDGADIGCRNGVHGIAGFNLKGSRGVVVLPGSIHPNTGNQFTFVAEKELQSLAELPVFDVCWLNERRSDTPLSLPNRRGSFVETGIKNVRACLRGTQSVQGQRGSHVCFRVDTFLFDHAFSREVALAEVLSWNETNAFPPSSTLELVHKIGSVWKRKMQRGINS